MIEKCCYPLTSAWYTCKLTVRTLFNVASALFKQVPFAISNTWGTNSLKCCDNSVPLFFGIVLESSAIFARFIIVFIF